VLAIGATPWYSSATFWTGAGAAIALLALLVSVVLWFVGSPRRLLVYGLTSDTPLPSSDARSRVGTEPDLQITLSGQALSDPHVASIVVASRSRSDIRSTDFDEGKPLIFDLGAPILKLLDCNTGGQAMPQIRVAVDGNKVGIGPSLIHRRQVISLDLLIDGPAVLNCGSPSLADVTIRDGTKDNVEPRWVSRTAIIPTALFFIAFFAATVSNNPHDKSLAISWILSFIAMGGILLIVVIALTARAVRQGGISRVRPWISSPPGGRR
jgi:hypothetical protein